MNIALLFSQEAWRNITVIFDQRLQFFKHALMPAGDVHVQGVVTARPLICRIPPLVKSSQQAGARLRNNMINCEEEG